MAHRDSKQRLLQPETYFLRKEIRTIMEAYLRCGIHQYGFSRLMCDDCGFERLVPFSCRKRGLCASCHTKTLAHWSEWLLTT